MKIKLKESAAEALPAVPQLSLFSFLPENISFSNTIELYDAIPRIVPDKRSKSAVSLTPIEQKFNHRGKDYKITITPAKIKNKDGKWIEILPGQREGFVEEALRRFATESKGVAVGDQLGVAFTFYELREELKRTGHTYNYMELREALDVLTSCNMRLVLVLDEGKEELYSESLFGRMAGKTEEGWTREDGKKTAFIVFFNSLVKKSIMELTFRRYNYEICMSYKSVVSRYLHKRMSHNYTQASILNPYNIKLSSIISGSGIKKYARLSDNHKLVAKALEEMKDKMVLMNWKYEKKEQDYLYILTPSPNFANEMKVSNQRYTNMLNMIER